MSIEESNFIKWFAGIAASLIIASILGLVGMYHSQAVNTERIKTNEANIKILREYHHDDILLIRDDLKEIKYDIKQLLTTDPE